MPKKQEGYESAIGSIFDFIFANNQKRPGKPYVHRPSGVSGTDELTQAMAEIASKPYTYMSDAALNHLDETFLGEGLMEVYLDQKDGKKYKFNYDPKASRFRIRLSDLSTAMADPRKFIDKVDKKMKEQRRWIALTGATAALDSAVAIGVGKRQGMSTKEALVFGKAARVSYDPQMTEMQKELTAGSAASNAAFERAKKQAENEGLATNSTAYQQRVFDIVKGSKSAIEGDSKMLYEAMRSSRTARRTRYFSDPDITAATADVEDYLKKHIGYNTPTEQAKVDTLMAEFKSEVDYAKAHGGATISGYRMTYARNQGLRAQFASSQAELDRAVKAQSFTYAWERIKGGGEYADFGHGIRDLDREIAHYDKLAQTDPKYKALVKDLKAHKGKLAKVQDDVYKDIRGGRDFWQAPTTAFPPRAKKERVIEGAKEVVRSDITRWQFLMDNATNEADKKRYEIQLRAAQEAIGAISLVPGSEIRNRIDSYISTFNVFQAGLVQGGIGGGLIDGSSYHNKGAAGMFAPGTFGDVTVQHRDGFILDKGDYYMVLGERVRYSGGIVVSQSGKKYSIANGFLVDSKGNQVVGKDGKQLKLNEQRLKLGYQHKGLVLPRDEVNQHFARLAGAYYLTPTSLLKTALWNGEGFSYLASRNQLAIQRAFAYDRHNLLSDFINGNKTLFAGVADLFDSQSGAINPAVLATNYTQIIDILNNSSVKLPEGLKRVLRAANRRSKRAGRFSRLGDLISTNIADKWGAMVGNVKKWVSEKLTKFFQRFTKDQLVKDQIAKFFSGGIGLRQIVSEGIKAGIMALANAIGFVTSGGLANVIITAVAWIGTEAVMSLTKPLLGILLICMWGVCGIIGFFVFSLDIIPPSNVAHANMPPQDVVACGVEMYPVGPSDTEPTLGFGDPPHDGRCPVAQAAVCTQGPNGSFSHARMGTMAIDTGYTSGLWRAPSDGEVTKYIEDLYCPIGGGYSYGGLMIFTDYEGNEYRIIHVAALVGLGPVSQGTAIARMRSDLVADSGGCWTGTHYHHDVKSNGGWVNAFEWFNALGCNLDPCLYGN